jgi:hypothetical protein
VQDTPNNQNLRGEKRYFSMLHHPKILLKWSKKSTQKKWSKKLNYQRIEACNYSIQYKDQEYLVVLMSNTVINPNTMMVLNIRS